MVSKSNLAKVEREQICSPLDVIVFYCYNSSTIRIRHCQGTLPELGLKGLQSCLKFELFLKITADFRAKCVFE